MSSNVKIATAPCSWGVWYPDGKPSGTPWNIFLDQIAQAGYSELELGPVGYLPTDNKILAAELEKRNLKVCSGTSVYQFDKMSSFEDKRADVIDLCDRLKSFNAKYLVVMDESDVGDHSEKKASYTSDIWNKYLKMFQDMGEFTKKEYGIQTVFHPHIGSLIETEHEIEMLLNNTSLNLCFDTGHHVYTNGEIEANDQSSPKFMKKHASRIPYLHFKNVSGAVLKKVREENLTCKQAFDIDVMCNLQDGVINFVQLKNVLDEINYNGVGVIETDMPRATTDQAFASGKLNLEYLRKIGIID